MSAEDSVSLPLLTRLWFAWVCFFRVLLGGPPAGALWNAASAVRSADAALQLLAILQGEGRLIDFVEQDVASFTDAEVGAAARAVHDGCRKALRRLTKLSPIRSEQEGTRLTLADGFAPGEIKLTGNVRGSAPYTGTLRHCGWRATELTLPTAVRAYDATILAPAEVEL